MDKLGPLLREKRKSNLTQGHQDSRIDQSCIMDSLESDMKLLLDALNFIQDDTDQQIQALKTLATMCSDGKGSQYLHQNGGLKTITDLFCNSASPLIKQWSLYALSNAVQEYVPNKKLLCIPEMMKQINLVLGTGKSSVLTVVGSNFLLALSSNFGPAQDLVRTEGCLKKLVDMYRLSLPRTDIWFDTSGDACKDLWTTVSSTLCSLMSDPQNDKNKIACSSLLPQAISVLKNTSSEIIATCLNFIGHCISNNAKTQRTLNLVGGFNALLNLLKKWIGSNDETGTAVAAHALQTISCGLTEFAENRRTVASLNIVPVIIDIMRSNETTEAVISSALVCLSRCVDDCEQNRQILFECNGLQTLISVLITTKDEETRKITLFILQNCLPIPQDKLSSLDCSNLSSLLINNNKRLNVKDDMLIGKLMEKFCGIENQPAGNDFMEQLLAGTTPKLSSGISSKKRSIPANDSRSLNNLFVNDLDRGVVACQYSNASTSKKTGNGYTNVDSRYRPSSNNSDRQIGSTGEKRNQEFKMPQSTAVKSIQRMARNSNGGSATRVTKPTSVDCRQVLREVGPKENSMIMDILADHTKMLAAVNNRVNEMENDLDCNSHASTRNDLQFREYASSKYEIESRGYKSPRNDLEPRECASSQYEPGSRGCASSRYGRGPKSYADLTSNIESRRYAKQNDIVDSRGNKSSKCDYKSREHSGSRCGLENRGYAGSSSDVRNRGSITLKNNVEPRRYASSIIQNDSPSTVISTHHKMKRAASIISSRAGTLSNCRRASNIRIRNSTNTAVAEKRSTLMSKVFTAKNNTTETNLRQLENVKLCETAVSNILHGSKNGKAHWLGQSDPSLVHQASSVRETPRGHGSRHVKSMEITITPNSRRQIINLPIQPCEPEMPFTSGYQKEDIEAIGKSGQEKSFDVIESMTDCRETAKDNQPASSSRFKRNGPLRRSFTKRNYRHMKLRDKSESNIVSEIPTIEQSSHDKVKGWIEKNHIESHDSEEKELDGRSTTSALNRQQDMSWRGNEKHGTVFAETAAKPCDAMLMGSSAEKSMTPTDKLPTRMAQAGYKVKRSLGFVNDNVGQENSEGDYETQNKDSLCDYRMSDVSSEADSPSLLAKETSKQRHNESLNPSDDRKCLGCYPFARFPFFVLNNRNCKGVLQKDEHTCKFHRNLLNSDRLADDFSKHMEIRTDATERCIDATTPVTATDARYPKRKRTQTYGSVTRVAGIANNELETRSAMQESRKERNSACPSVNTTKSALARKRRKRQDYEDYEIDYIYKGVKRYGRRWNAILSAYDFKSGRTSEDLKDKYKQLHRKQSSAGTAASTICRRDTIRPFTAQEIVNLKTGYGRYGARWKTILNGFQFQKGRTAEELQQKYSKVLNKF